VEGFFCFNEGVKKWWWGLAILVVLSATIGVYRLSGYGYWVRAQDKIAQLRADGLEVAWRELDGYDPDEVHGGILAGNVRGRVWLWGTDGLSSYPTDSDTVYSWFDGCKPEILELLNNGVSGAFERYIFTQMGEWNSKMEVGDYVRVIVNNGEVGGTAGFAREVYGYNYWLFLPARMEERCAK
jgi:hypothetical protein